MGQRQSTSNDEQEETPAKADYYELLGVERTASEDEIKKAYRRKALELHPDRNYGNVEHATNLFAEIQSAYEVLSDPQERAWYDSHKDILLRGDQASGPGANEFSYNIRMTTAEEVMKLMMKFNGRMEFNNSPSGFFGGLNDFFKQLANEEDIACQWENQEGTEYPEFGLDEDDYEDVVRPFYAMWNGFATRKSHSWKDQYKLSDAPDRRIRRLMEKENKKLRDDAIQEYNEAVRSLVAFVRKRDPRVQNNQKSEAERQKALREATAAQAARSRAARQAKLEDLDSAVIPDWAKSRAKDDHEGGFSSESDLDQHEYDCVVCDKTFKSEAQYTAHEKSKKHIKLLKQLQKDMRAEGKDLQLDTPEDLSHRDRDDEIDDMDMKPESIVSAKEEPAASMDRGSDSSDRSVNQKETNGVTSTATEELGVSDEDEDEDEDGDDYAPRSEVEQRLAGGPADDISTTLEGTSLEGTPATSDLEGSSQPKIGRAKQKRAKKAAQLAAQHPTESASEHQCIACKSEFSSKNQLFEHLKKTKHAAPLGQAKSAKSGRGKQR